MKPVLQWLALLLVCAPAVAGGLAPGNHDIALNHGGLARSYIAHLPPQAGAGRPLPVVINLHGGGGHARAYQEYVSMDALADSEGFIVVYPNGTGRLKSRLLTWNAGSCCGSAAAGQVDDVGFITALLDDLALRTEVDARRVYATGLSNGAMMAYRLAAELPERIAAVAPVAGAMVLERFAPKRPVPVMHIHSVDDPRALYVGGLGPPFPMTNSRVMHSPVAESLGLWAGADGCGAEAHSVEPPRSNAMGHTAEKLSFAPCAAGTEVVHWKLKGPGHVWPGGRRDYLRRILGPGTDVIDANLEIWRFFSRHALAAAQ